MKRMTVMTAVMVSMGLGACSSPQDSTLKRDSVYQGPAMSGAQALFDITEVGLLVKIREFRNRGGMSREDWQSFETLEAQIKNTSQGLQSVAAKKAALDSRIGERQTEIAKIEAEIARDQRFVDISTDEHQTSRFEKKISENKQTIAATRGEIASMKEELKSAIQELEGGGKRVSAYRADILKMNKKYKVTPASGAMKFVAAVAQWTIIVDLAGKIVVWECMDASPGFTSFDDLAKMAPEAAEKIKAMVSNVAGTVDEILQ